MAAATDAQDQLEIRRAEEFIEETPKLDGVDSVTVELGEDHTGDPAMWLVFHTHKDDEVDPIWIRQFIDYAAVIQRKILDSGLTRFPYTRLE